MEHEVRDCSNTIKCYICAEEGHRADSIGCPKYRDAVKLEKRRFETNKGNKSTWRKDEKQNIKSTALVEKTNGVPGGSQEKGAALILAGDINARSPMWDGDVTNQKGEMMGDVLAMNGLILLNDENNPTYERGGSKSYIDITAYSEKVVQKVCLSTRKRMIRAKASGKGRAI